MTPFLTEYTRQCVAGMHIKADFGAIPHLALGLCGEAGEVADEIKKSQYTNGALNVANVEQELGDVLWYLTVFADRFGLTLEDLARINLKKLAARRPNDYTYRDDNDVIGTETFLNNRYILPTENGE